METLDSSYFECIIIEYDIVIYYDITICSNITLIIVYDGNRCNIYNRNKLVTYKCLARAHGNKTIGLCQLSLFIGICFHNALHI